MTKIQKQKYQPVDMLIKHLACLAGHVRKRQSHSFGTAFFIL